MAGRGLRSRGRRRLIGCGGRRGLRGIAARRRRRALRGREQRQREQPSEQRSEDQIPAVHVPPPEESHEGHAVALSMRRAAAPPSGGAVTTAVTTNGSADRRTGSRAGSLEAREAGTPRSALGGGGAAGNESRWVREERARGGNVVRRAKGGIDAIGRDLGGPRASFASCPGSSA